VILACRDIAAEPPATAPSPGVFTFGGPPAASPSPAPPPSVNGDVEQARRLLAQGNLAEAIPLLQKATSENPGNSEFQHLLGRALWTTGNRDAAVQSYFQAARIDPASYRLEYAQALETVGRTDDAAAELEASLAAQPGNAAVEETLGRIYYNKGEYAKAGPLLDSVAARTKDPVVLQQLAYAAEKNGDHDRAIATYREVLDTQPRADVARGQLAESLLAAGRGNEAITVLQEGLQRTPEAPLLQRGLGSMLERSGRPAEAAAAYREYARLAPNAPDAAEVSARAAQLEASVKGS
jgi:predicted Zn-dependent protease